MHLYQRSSPGMYKVTSIKVMEDMMETNGVKVKIYQNYEVKVIKQAILLSVVRLIRRNNTKFRGVKFVPTPISLLAMYSCFSKTEISQLMRTIERKMIRRYYCSIPITELDSFISQPDNSIRYQFEKKGSDVCIYELLGYAYHQFDTINSIGMCPISK
jgi:hypothetical protein